MSTLDASQAEKVLGMLETLDDMTAVYRVVFPVATVAVQSDGDGARVTYVKLTWDHGLKTYTAAPA